MPSESWWSCACRNMHGVAQPAHGPNFAERCPHPTGGASQSRDFRPARIAPAAIRTDRGTCFSWSGTDPDAPHRALHVRHRPVPVSPPCPRTRVLDGSPASVAGFARSPEREPPASGATMASVSLRVLPHVTANPERLSSRLVENVRDPSGGGSTASVTRARKVGMKWGEYRLAAIAAPLSSLVGEKAKSMA